MGSVGAETFLTLWTLQRACDVQIAASHAGALHPFRADGFPPDSPGVPAPGEKRTCDDVFAAIQRRVDAVDAFYRD